MNKNQLIREIARRTGLTIRLSKIVVNCLTQAITSELEQGHKISLKDFGAFYNVTRQGKTYFDFRANEMRKSVPKNVVKFTPYKGFKKLLCPNIIELRSDNDGSLENSIVLRQNVFTCQQPTKRKTSTVNSTPEIGKQNIGKRQRRKQDLSSSNLVFEGNFLYDKFQGESDHNTFPSLKVPHKGTPILVPQKDKTGATMGVMELVLQKILREICKELKEVCILENVKLPILNRNYSYRPDICLYWEKKNVYIDIEIDEPYDIVSRKPIHYMGNGDNLRDRYFIRNGWCVIRFTEQQVHDNLDGVANYIKRVLSWLVDDINIKFEKDSLDSSDRWSYEQAENMASDNIREHYLGLPNYTPTERSSQQVEDNTSDLVSSIFTKPNEDILPQRQESKWVSVVDEIKKSSTEYCKVIKTDGYQWIYNNKQLKIVSKNGIRSISGKSPFEVDFEIPLYEISGIVPMDNLFSNVQWEYRDGMQLEDLDEMRDMLFNAIAKGSPIWIAYTSNNSGYGTRFLSNLVCDWMGSYYSTPHIGLGYCKKYGMSSLSHFHGYCSNRKEFRMFATDYRLERLKVLNCNNVYLFPEVYTRSFAQLIMAPYNDDNGLTFFENADEILEIMPQNELDSLLTQGNLANLQVMKGDVDKAIELYKQNPYNLFITPNSTWGETCIADIKFFINLFNEHLDDTHDYYNFNAKSQLANFEEVLKQLNESSWMKQ